MSESVETVLRRMIAKQVNVDPAAVTPEASLDALGVGSLDLVEIIMSIEDEYDVTVPLDANEASKTLSTVGDLIALGNKLGLAGT